MKKESKLKQAFALFQDENHIYPVLRSPFLKDGNVWATDAHVAIFVDEKDCDFSYKNKYVNEAPDVSKLIKVANTSKVLKITEAEFEKLRTKEEIVSEEFDCDTCDGNGSVNWTFEAFVRKDDCPVCNGTCKRKMDKKTGKKVFGNFIVKSSEAYFLPANFYKIIQVQNLLGGDVELVFEKDGKTAQCFRIGKCTIVIMPCLIEGMPNFDAILEIN